MAAVEDRPSASSQDSPFEWMKMDEVPFDEVHESSSLSPLRPAHAAAVTPESEGSPQPIQDNEDAAGSIGEQPSTPDPGGVSTTASPSSEQQPITDEDSFLSSSQNQPTRENHHQQSSRNNNNFNLPLYSPRRAASWYGTSQIRNVPSTPSYVPVTPLSAKSPSKKRLSNKLAEQFSKFEGLDSASTNNKSAVPPLNGSSPLKKKNSKEEGLDRSIQMDKLPVALDGFQSPSQKKNALTVSLHTPRSGGSSNMGSHRSGMQGAAPGSVPITPSSSRSSAFQKRLSNSKLADRLSKFEGSNTTTAIISTSSSGESPPARIQVKEEEMEVDKATPSLAASSSFDKSELDGSMRLDELPHLQVETASSSTNKKQHELQSKDNSTILPHKPPLGGSHHTRQNNSHHGGMSTSLHTPRRSSTSNIGGGSSHLRHSVHSATPTSHVPSTPLSGRSAANRRLSNKLADRCSKFGGSDSNLTMNYASNPSILHENEPGGTESSNGGALRVPLSETGRRRSVRSSLVGLVKVFDTPKRQRAQVNPLLSPMEVKQLVLSTATNKRLHGIVYQYEHLSEKDQRQRLQDRTSAKERQRALFMSLNKDARRLQWEQARARFGATLNKDRTTKQLGQVPISFQDVYKEIRAPQTVDYSNFVPPDHGTKTDRQRELILQCVERSFCFTEFRPQGKARTQGALEALIQAFECVQLELGSVLWYQGTSEQATTTSSNDDDNDNQAFYVVEKGSIAFHANGVAVGSVQTEDWFGEQSLLYPAPSAVTVSVAIDPDNQGKEDGAHLLKLEPSTYRGLLHLFSQRATEEKRQVLLGVDFLKDLLDFHSGAEESREDDDLLRRLASIMTRVEFSKGDVVDAPEDVTFYVVESGELLVKNNSGALQKSLGAGQYFGERALIGSLPRRSMVWGQNITMTATSDHGVVFQINRAQMEAILGPRRLQNLQDIHRMSKIALVERARLSHKAKALVANQIVEHSCDGKDDTVVLDVGCKATPALYVVRKGTVTVSFEDDRKSQTLTCGDVFGQDFLEEKKDINGDSTIRRTAGFQFSTADGQFASIGVLPLPSLGLKPSASQHSPRTSLPMSNESQRDTPALAMRATLELRNKVRQLVQTNISLDDLEKLTLLGEGEFGEVWLVAADIFQTGDADLRQKFALKSQRKVDETRGKDAVDAIRREIQVMREIDHPQIVDLVHIFEDEENLYMLMGLISGGELWDRIHTEDSQGNWLSGMSEGNAKFYTMVIADTLDYMHSCKYIFRDLKPENIMIDSDGYPVIVDFGFAKYCPDVTWTFCGTPNYVAPEIVTHSGHNRCVDHWALGITLYEMITGENPFYFEGMDPTALYDAICREPHYPLSKGDGRSDELISLVDGLLEKDPTKRLGMLAGGMNDILKHAWFDGVDLGQVRSKKWPAPWKPESSADVNATEDLLLEKMGLNIHVPSLDESTQSFNASFASILEDDNEDNDDVSSLPAEEQQRESPKHELSKSEGEEDVKDLRDEPKGIAIKKKKKKAKAKVVTEADFQFVSPVGDRRYQPISKQSKRDSQIKKQQSKTRRSAISETLAGLGIDSDDEYPLF